MGYALAAFVVTASAMVTVSAALLALFR